jgi:hypothetical protein
MFLKTSCGSCCAVLDVIRNEMFKTSMSLTQTVRHLYDEMGYTFMVRGVGKNMVAVAIPVGCTIFFTDALIQFTTNKQKRDEEKKTHTHTQHE